MYRKSLQSNSFTGFLAEGVRFELTVGFPITSFQDWLLKPLGQPSIRPRLYHLLPGKSRGIVFAWQTGHAVLEYSGNHILPCYSEWYPRGRRGSPAKGVGGQKPREGSNPSHSATEKPAGIFFRLVFLLSRIPLFYLSKTGGRWSGCCLLNRQYFYTIRPADCTQTSCVNGCDTQTVPVAFSISPYTARQSSRFFLILVFILNYLLKNALVVIVVRDGAAVTGQNFHQIVF